MKKERKEPWLYVIAAPFIVIAVLYFFGPAIYEFLWATGILTQGI